MPSTKLIEDVTVDLLRVATTSLPDDVLGALREAERDETSEVARTQLRTILKNVEAAERLALPMCQDTGMPIFFVKGRCLTNLEEGVRRGVERATSEVPLRPNAVHPIDRRNPGNNLGKRVPIIHYDFSEDDFTQLTVMPKGAGSENMSALAMLTPSQGIKGIKRLVLDTVVRAGGKPCPPVIVGVGIGGSADLAMVLAKQALLRPLHIGNQDPKLAAFESEMKQALNLTGIGPMGLGGKTTVLGVRVEEAYTHTASLPVAICMQCWAARRASARIAIDGTIQYSREGFW